MKQADLKKIFQGLDAQITKILSFSAKIEKEPCYGIKSLMPSQLNKYSFSCYSIPTTKYDWNDVPNILEALTLIPLISVGLNKKMSDACEQSIQLIKDTNLETKFKELLINGYYNEIKKNRSSQSAIIFMLKLLLFNIQVLRETNLKLQKNLSTDNFQISIERKLRPIEVALDIKIIAKIVLTNDKKLHFYYPKKQQSTEKPYFSILLDKNIRITQVQYIDYKNYLNPKELGNQLVLFHENPDKFCTQITKNILVLFYLKNLLNQIVWTGKKSDCTLRDVTDSFIFDAAGEVIDAMQQEISIDIFSKQINQNQIIELKWDNLVGFKEQFAKQLKESKYFKKIEGANVIVDQMPVGYDCFIESLPKNQYKTISFRERANGISSLKSTISWISIEEKDNFIRKLAPKLENVIVAFESNKLKQFPQQFSVYQILSGVNYGVIDVVQLSILSYLLQYSQSSDDEYMEQQFKRKDNNQSTQKEIAFFKLLYQSIKSMMEFSNLKEGLLINNNINIQSNAKFMIQLLIEKHTALFDPTIDEEVQIEKITKYLNEIGVKVVVVKSNDRDDQFENLKQVYFSSGVDILVHVSQNIARVFIQMLRKTHQEEADQVKNRQTDNQSTNENGYNSAQKGINQEKQLRHQKTQTDFCSTNTTGQKDEGQSNELQQKSAKLPQTESQSRLKTTENSSLQNNQSNSNTLIQFDTQIIEKPHTIKQPLQREITRTQTAYRRENYSEEDLLLPLNISDLPEQIFFHSDLFYLVKDWEQVLALFYLFNIKDQILLRDNPADEDSLYPNMSTKQLIRSILFVFILNKCRNEGIQKDETPKLRWDQTSQDYSNQITSQLPYQFKINKNIRNYSASQKRNKRDYQNTQYDAEIQFPSDSKYKYIVEFTPQRNSKSHSGNTNP